MKGTTKLHTIKWEIICKPKVKGGLGVQVLAWKNTAILAKWWWKARIDKSKLWHRVLTCKYGENFFSNPKGGKTHSSPMIRHIAAVQDFGQMKLFNPSDLVWKLGQGDKSRFWKDNWLRNTILADRFQRLYMLSIHKNASVGSMLNIWNSARTGSSIHWRRDLRGWE